MDGRRSFRRRARTNPATAHISNSQYFYAHRGIVSDKLLCLTDGRGSLYRYHYRRYCHHIAPSTKKDNSDYFYKHHLLFCEPASETDVLELTRLSELATGTVFARRRRDPPRQY